MSFWTVHGYLNGIFFLAGLVFLPRLTLLFTVPLGATATEIVAYFMLSAWVGIPLSFALAIVFWIAWLIVPRFLIAFLASWFYLETNLGLCVGACIIAVSISVTFLMSYPQSKSKRQIDRIRTMIAKAIVDHLQSKPNKTRPHGKTKSAKERLTYDPNDNDLLFDDRGKPYRLSAVRTAYIDQLRQRA